MIEKKGKWTSSWTNLLYVRYNIEQDQTNFIILSHPVPLKCEKQRYGLTCYSNITQNPVLKFFANKKKIYIPSLDAKCLVTFITLYHINKIKLPVDWATDPKKLRVHIKSGSYQLHKKYVK